MDLKDQKPGDAAVKCRRICRSFTAQLESLESVRQFVLEQAKESEVPQDRLADIELIIEEIFVNIASYAYPQGSGQVQICCFEDNDRLFCLEFTDSGVPFNPLEKPPPALDVGLEEREIGGLGIHLVRQISATTEYQRREARNILTVGIRP